MKQLDNLQNVCKYWSIVSDDSRLWFSVNFACLLKTEYSELKFSNKKTIQQFDKHLNILVKDLKAKGKFNFIVKLDLSNLVLLNSEQLELILSNCNSDILTGLSVANCKRISHSNKNKNLFENVIADNCPKLKYLSLSGLDVN